MSREKLTELEKRIAQEKTKEARAFAKLERLSEDIARVERALEEMGISSIEEAKERLTTMHARMEELIAQSYRKLEEGEK